MIRNPIREAVTVARGWPYCAEHDAPRYHGSDACIDKHVTVRSSSHVYWCSFPDRDCICPAYVVVDLADTQGGPE